MADHEELVAEMLALEQMGTQERQKLAKKRRLQQLKKWGQREKEWIAKERQLNKRLANMLHEENNGLDLKQYTAYGSNQRPKRRLPPNSITTNTSGANSHINNNNIISNNNNSTKLNGNSKDYLIRHADQNGDYVDSNLVPNGRVHFNVGVMLLEAAARNDIDEVKRLLMLGVSPDSVNHDGLTALHQCCIDASEPIMNLLLEFGANVDARDTEQWTPLHAACTCGHLNLVKILVKHGADLLAVNGDGNMPFDICEDEATLDYIESQMVQRGITQEMIDITRASTEMQMISDLEKLIANGCDLNEVANENGVTPLHIAAANGYLSVVKFLLKHGVNVNVCDRDQWRPLHGAACWGNEQHCDVVELLVESGAQLNAKTLNDETAFDLCDNAGLLEKMNHLKDELESKQATDTSKLKRAQSRTNSRVHSVRRTSVRDKNQISRREAREEALLRTESAPALANNISNECSNGAQEPIVRSLSNGQTPQVRGDRICPPEPTKNQTDGPKTTPEVNGGQTDQSETQDSNQESLKQAAAHRSQAPLSTSVHTSDKQQLKVGENVTVERNTDHLTDRSTDPGQGDISESRKKPQNTSFGNHLDQKVALATIRDRPAQTTQPLVASMSATNPSNLRPQNQQTSMSAVQLVPVNYTLANLKKHRSDLRMRTTSIGGGSITLPTTSLDKETPDDQQASYTSAVSLISGSNSRQRQNSSSRHQVVLDPRSNLSDDEIGSSRRPESPGSTFRKFHGEPSDDLDHSIKHKKGHKCCIII